MYSRCPCDCSFTWQYPLPKTWRSLRKILISMFLTTLDCVIRAGNWNIDSTEVPFLTNFLPRKLLASIHNLHYGSYPQGLWTRSWRSYRQSVLPQVASLPQSIHSWWFLPPVLQTQTAKHLISSPPFQLPQESHTSIKGCPIHVLLCLLTASWLSLSLIILNSNDILILNILNLNYILYINRTLVLIHGLQIVNHSHSPPPPFFFYIWVETLNQNLRMHTRRIHGRKRINQVHA